MDSFEDKLFEISEEMYSSDGINNILDINKNDLFNEIDLNKIKNENYENNDSLVKIPKEIGNTFQTSKTYFLNFSKNEEKYTENIIKVDNNMNKNNEKNIQNTKKHFFNVKNEKLRSKFSEDNIISKLRKHLIKFGVNLLNDLIKKEFGKQLYKIRFLTTKITDNININFNKTHFLYLSLELIYSNETNNSYKTVNIDENKVQISKLRKKKDKAPLTNKLLDMTFYDLYNIYINKNTKEIKKKYGLKKALMFYDFIKELKKKESKPYIEKLECWIINFYNYFLYRWPRKTKKTKKKN